MSRHVLATDRTEPPWVDVVPLPENRSRLTISITFEGHGIRKVLVPLAVEPGVPKEMARDTATLKHLLEGGMASA